MSLRPRTLARVVQRTLARVTSRWDVNWQGNQRRRSGWHPAPPLGPNTTRELAEIGDLLAVALASGHSVLHAVEVVCRSTNSETATVMTTALDSCGDVVAPADALARLPDVLGEASRPLLSALVTAVRYGSPIVPALERASFELRLARRTEAHARTKRVSVLLLFPLVLCVLPAFVLLTIVPMVVAALSALPGAGL